MLRASRDLWVESLGDRVKVENVLTRRDVVISPEDLEHLELNSVSTAESSGDLGNQIVRAVDRLLKAHAPESRPTDVLERFALCRSYCLEDLDLNPETSRDLKAVFNTAESFLREESDRQFEYTTGLLQTLWQRPTLEYGFGQLPCMPETTQRRVALAKPLLRPDSRCLILGDDDLMGLCWGLMYPQLCDVFELDQRLLEFYQRNPKDSIVCHQRDLTQGLPNEFHGLYRVIYTDPMYGKQGMNMFLLCCSQGLSQSPRARLFLNTRPDLIEEGDRLPERLANLGLYIVNKKRSFSRYRFPEQTRRMAFEALGASGLPRYFLRGLLKVPYYYSDLLEVARIP